MRDRIPNPTKPYDPQLQAQIDATMPGMAHWAGTGPTDRTCRECRHSGNVKRDKAGFIKSITCSKGSGKPFRHACAACKHFVLFEGKPPDIKIWVETGWSR